MVAEKLDTDRMDAAIHNWRDDIKLIAGVYLPDDTRESWLARAARRAGITFRQCRALYYREVTDPRHSVATKINRAADQAREQAADLASRYEAIAGSLYAQDKEFFGDQIVELVDVARALRNFSGTGARRPFPTKPSGEEDNEV